MISLSRCVRLFGQPFAAVEPRGLRRQLPNAHRAWVPAQSSVHGIRPETDHEYLARLRRCAEERTPKATH